VVHVPLEDEAVVFIAQWVVWESTLLLVTGLLYEHRAEAAVNLERPTVPLFTIGRELLILLRFLVE